MTSDSAAVRLPAVAGLFYPASERQLKSQLEHLIAGAERSPLSGSPAGYKAIVVPHAGFMYCGPVAASVYARLLPLRGKITRVVLLGPAHRLWFEGLALPAAEAFRTPLGDVEVDAAAIAALRGFDQVRVVPGAHEQEHSLEVQLPFLQHVLGTFKLAPLVVGEAAPADVAAVLDRLWGGPETLIVISSDLSHYESYDRARRHDAQTAAEIERGGPTTLGPDDACGCGAINGLLLSAAARGLRCSRLDLRNSGDIAGERERVVGYGAWGFTARPPC
jgi:AmmeMemoRadiSam system protein B